MKCIVGVEEINKEEYVNQIFFQFASQYSSPEALQNPLLKLDEFSNEKLMQNYQASAGYSTCTVCHAKYNEIIK